LGFKAQSELPGATGRLDICVELPGQVYVIIELKYCPDQKKLTKKEEDQALASLAMDKLSLEILYESLAQMAKKKLDTKTIFRITSESQQNNLTAPERNKLLAQAALELLPQAVIDKTLALTAREKLPCGEIETALLDTKPDLSEEEIDSLLSAATDQALCEIVDGGYQGIVPLDAKEIISLGVAIYGIGAKIKAAFEPN
jgi:hypothetical protein